MREIEYDEIPARLNELFLEASSVFDRCFRICDDPLAYKEGRKRHYEIMIHYRLLSAVYRRENAGEA